jgi:hypothetical protein
MVQIHTSATSQPGLVSARTLVTYTIVINNKTNWHPSCHYNIIVSNHMVQSPNSDVLTYQKGKKRGALIFIHQSSPTLLCSIVHHNHINWQIRSVSQHSPYFCPTMESQDTVSKQAWKQTNMEMVIFSRKNM